MPPRNPPPKRPRDYSRKSPLQNTKKRASPPTRNAKRAASPLKKASPPTRKSFLTRVKERRAQNRYF
jgi:hypothetical protein